jgi:hypothetical protein
MPRPHIDADIAAAAAAAADALLMLLVLLMLRLLQTLSTKRCPQGDNLAAYKFNTFFYVRLVTKNKINLFFLLEITSARF